MDLLLRAGAFPEPTFLWWEVRPQPRFGTVEVRIMDAQLTSSRSGSLAALIQSISRLELEEGYHDADAAGAELLDENRFLAARDGMNAMLIDPVAQQCVPARELLAQVLEAVRPHAAALGCGRQVESLSRD